MSDVIDSFTGPYAFLSNFAPVDVRYPDYESPTTLTYMSVEAAYQAAKTHDLAQRKWVQAALTAGEAKRRGQKVSMKATWNANARLQVMSGLLRQKFAQEPFRSQLLATGDAELIEGNIWHDQAWGDCRCPQHVGQGGLNWLGSLLMKIRSQIPIDDSL